MGGRRRGFRSLDDGGGAGDLRAQYMAQPARQAMANREFIGLTVRAGRCING